MDVPRRVWWFFVRPLWIQKLMTFAWHIMVSVYVAVSVCWNLDQKQNDRLKFQVEENHPGWWRLKISKGFMLNFWVESLCWLLPLRVSSNYCSVKLHCCPENEGRKYNPWRFEEQHNWGTRMDGRWWFSNIRSNFNLDISNLQYTMALSLFPWTSHSKRIF